MNNIKTRIIISLLLLAIIGISMVSAKTDVAYVVTNDAEPAFIDAMEELGMSYEVIPHTDVDEHFDFSRYRILLINNDYFVKWYYLPVNNMPALIANTYHVDEFGWAVRTTLISSLTGVNVSVNQSHELAQGLPSMFKAYTSNKPDINVLDRLDIYDGFEYVAPSYYDQRDAVVAIVKNGTVLTKGTETTHVNANSVFFGITETESWSPESKTLFKNCLSWLYQESNYTINLNSGWNLVSFPLEASSTKIEQAIDANPQILEVKEYDTSVEEIIDSSSYSNNKGYFIKTNSATTLTISGDEAEESQSVHLEQGMNLVGLTSLTNYDISNLPSQVVEVAKRNTDGTYNISTKYSGNWLNEFELKPGIGYWFKTTSQVTWTYTP